MHLQLTDEQRSLQLELRKYFKSLVTREYADEMAGGIDNGPEYKRLVKKMGQDGWLGLGFPAEYGGRGGGSIEHYLFHEEAIRAGAPIPFIAINTVAPALVQFASDRQKDFFLPRIIAGEMHMAIGYSEPDAGTDLASLRTRAVRDGDDYLITGQKLWTTGAAGSDYIWLAARTDPDAKKHKGITVFLVDATLPGIRIDPIETLIGHRTYATFYENVRVPAWLRIGEENGGWQLMTTQLNFERSSIVATAGVEGMLAEVAEWTRQTPADGNGRSLADEQWVQLNLGRVHAKVEALRLMNLRAAWSVSAKQFNPANSSAVKVFGTELYVEAWRLLMEIAGECSVVKRGSPGAILDGGLERAYRQAVLTTFGGGVNEVQREIISMFGLNMPRAPR